MKIVKAIGKHLLHNVRICGEFSTDSEDLGFVKISFLILRNYAPKSSLMRLASAKLFQTCH